LEHGNTVWVQTGEPKEQYLTNVAWGPNDEYIYIALLNRDQNHVKLNQYNARNGEFVKTILEEKHDKYVQPLHPMEFLPNEGNQFVWQSEKDGFNHLYLYNLKGKELKQLTKGNWVVTGTQGFDESGNLIFTHTANRGMDRIVSRVNLKSGNIEKLTPVSGVHQVKMSSSGNYLIDRYSSLNKPLVVQVLNTQGKIIREITNAENPLKEYKVSLPELGMIKTHEGDMLNTRIFRPFDFDPSKKYKALVYVYNGPGVQLITNSWMAGAPLWMPYMANQGYIVFTVDGRGSENRGREFEQIIFRRLGEMELVDQLSGVEFLRGLDYVNPNKIAVHGWSYGGFMTTSLMLKAPGIFKVGVAGGPVMDWKYYEVMYTERFMDTPESNEAGFARASLLDKVQNLKGDLLIIHGADDDVVVPQHSIDFLKNSVDKGIQVDFFLYPGHKHNVRGKDRVHLMRKVLDYIDEKLED
jgi:dipeptidyl-peptidase-4